MPKRQLPAKGAESVFEWISWIGSKIKKSIFCMKKS